MDIHSANVLIPTVGILGLCIGSFLNVVIHRLPRMMEIGWRKDTALTLREWAEDPRFAEEKAAFEAGAEALESHNRRHHPELYNLVLPHSHCPGCGHAIQAWENIPILSYLWLRGRCSACKTRISPRYPLVELATGLLSAAAAWHFGFSLPLAGALALLWSLVALTLIDADTQYLPDSITLPLLWLGLLFNMQHAFVALPLALVGAVAGYLSLWSIFWAFKLLTGKEGMGYGDFKLLAALGAWLGAMQLPIIILAASVSALLVAIPQRLGWGQRFPFGPYLAAGGMLALFFGPALLDWYLPHY